MRFFVQRIDVVAERQSRDVRFEAIDDGPRLLARAAMTLMDRDLLARVREPLCGERFVYRLVQFAGGVIGYIEQFRRRRRWCRRDRRPPERPDARSDHQRQHYLPWLLHDRAYPLTLSESTRPHHCSVW
jgi:hypothetical protein